ncbi:MAG: hypothetical protein SPL02_02785 [Bacilli bacterium]|nr:hypothetical protein [Bacilli bacterium]MDY6430824.1 hypothetical protein [Bacilli bacterium]
MKDNEKTVSIDQLKLLDFATLFGVIIKALDDEDKRINANQLHSIETIVLLASSIMLPKGMSEEFWSSAILSIADALYFRTLASGSARPIILPPWDEQDHYKEDCHQFTDAFFILYGWKLAFNDEKQIDFSDYLGAIFTFSGVVLEGIYRGYHQEDENMKTLYKNFLESYRSTVKAEDKDRDLTMKLDAINSLVNQYIELRN